MSFSREGSEEPINGFQYLAGKPKLPSENIKSKKKNFCSIMRLEQPEVEKI